MNRRRFLRNSAFGMIGGVGCAGIAAGVTAPRRILVKAAKFCSGLDLQF